MNPDRRELPSLVQVENTEIAWIKIGDAWVRRFGNVTACVGEYADGTVQCHFLPPDRQNESLEWASAGLAPRDRESFMCWLDEAYRRHEAGIRPGAIELAGDSSGKDLPIR